MQKLIKMETAFIVFGLLSLFMCLLLFSYLDSHNDRFEALEKAIITRQCVLVLDEKQPCANIISWGVPTKICGKKHDQ